MNILIKNDIRILCDVRKNPLSRKFGFSKKSLQHIAEQVGIAYIHIPELGIDSKNRTSLHTIENYQLLFRAYAKTLPNLRAYIDYIHTLLQANTRIALTCYEKEPEMCHRHVIRDYLLTLYPIESIDL